MRDDSAFRYLFEGSQVVVILAELFLRAHGFRVYSMGTIFSPMTNAYVSPPAWLYVASEDYRGALEVLVFYGAIDGLAYVNDISLLLGQDLHNLLSADRFASIESMVALL